MLDVDYAQIIIRGTEYIIVLTTQTVLASQEESNNLINFVSEQLFPQYTPDQVVLAHQTLLNTYDFRCRRDIIFNLREFEWNQLTWHRASFVRT